jgi:hypothetical protein
MEEFMLEESKPIWQSRGVCGGVVAIVAAGTGRAGYAITPDQQAQILEAGALIASVIGGLIALWGLVKATRRIA